MKAVVMNPSQLKKHNKHKKANNKNFNTRGVTMAKKKTHHKRHNPANPKNINHHKKRNPSSDMMNTIAMSAAAMGGGFANNLLAAGVAKIAGIVDDKMKNIVKIGTAFGASLILPKFLPKNYAMAAVYGAMGSVGAQVLSSFTGISGDEQSIDVKRIIDEIDKPKQIAGTDGLIRTDGDLGLIRTDGDDEMVGDDTDGDDTDGDDD